jgi:hypothetical protein
MFKVSYKLLTEKVVEDHNPFFLNDDEIETLEKFGVTLDDLKRLWDQVSQIERGVKWAKDGGFRQLVSQGLSKFLHGEELLNFLEYGTRTAIS